VPPDIRAAIALLLVQYRTSVAVTSQIERAERLTRCRAVSDRCAARTVRLALTRSPVASQIHLTSSMSQRCHQSVRYVTRCVCRTRKSCSPRTLASEPLGPRERRVQRPTWRVAQRVHARLSSSWAIVSIPASCVAFQEDVRVLNWKDERRDFRRAGFFMGRCVRATTWRS